MSFQSVLSALRHRLAPLGRDRTRLRLQHLGMSEADLRALRPLVDGVAQQLGVALALDATQGDIVVVERGFASHVSMQALRAYCEDRPMVAIDVGNATRNPYDSVLERFEACQQDLLAQLRDIPLVRQSASRWAELDQAAGAAEAPSSREANAPPPFERGFDPGFDSRLDADTAPALNAGHQRLVEQLLSGMSNPAQPKLWLGYGPGACLEVDFEAGVVRMDPAAEQRLRINGELPSMAPPRAVPGARAIERALDLTVWDLGLACGDYRLLRQPPDWWHTPLLGAGIGELERFTRTPRHRILARRLGEAPATPSELRRQGLVSVRELRCFLQASLFLGLVDWTEPPLG